MLSALLYATSPSTRRPTTLQTICPRLRSGSWMPSDLTEKARDIFQKNGMAFLLGWILGMGLGQSLWDSITGVL